MRGSFGRYPSMKGPLSTLATFVSEAVGEAIFEGILAVVIGGPVWLINHFFGPFHVSTDSVALGIGVVGGVLGLVMFVAIGVSRHREAWKVRLFGAVVAVILAGSLYGYMVRKHV